MSIPGPPRELEWVAFVLVGEHWPQGDEDRMEVLSEAWRALSRDLDGLPGQLERVVSLVEAAGQGPALDQAVKYFRQINGGTDAVLPDLRAAIDNVAEGAHQVALEIQYAKLMIILFSAVLLSMIINLMYMAWFSAGTAASAIAGVVEAFRAAVKQLLYRLMVSTLRGALFMLGLDVAVQSLQIVLGSRKGLAEWDGQKTLFMASIGAMGGAFGAVLYLSRYIRHFGGSYLDTIIRSALSEALPEVVADEIVNHGGPDTGFRDGPVGGLLSGAVEGAIEHPTQVLRERGRTPLHLALLHSLVNMFGNLPGTGPAPDILKDLAPAPGGSDVASGKGHAGSGPFADGSSDKESSDGRLGGGGFADRQSGRPDALPGHVPTALGHAAGSQPGVLTGSPASSVGVQGGSGSPAPNGHHFRDLNPITTSAHHSWTTPGDSGSQPTVSSGSAGSTGGVQAGSGAPADHPLGDTGALDAGMSGDAGGGQEQAPGEFKAVVAEALNWAPPGVSAQEWVPPGMTDVQTDALRELLGAYAIYGEPGLAADGLADGVGPGPTPSERQAFTRHFTWAADLARRCGLLQWFLFAGFVHVQQSAQLAFDADLARSFSGVPQAGPSDAFDGQFTEFTKTARAAYLSALQASFVGNGEVAADKVHAAIVRAVNEADTTIAALRKGRPAQQPVPVPNTVPVVTTGQGGVITPVPATMPPAKNGPASMQPEQVQATTVAHGLNQPAPTPADKSLDGGRRLGGSGGGYRPGGSVPVFVRGDESGEVYAGHFVSWLSLVNEEDREAKAHSRDAWTNCVAATQAGHRTWTDPKGRVWQVAETDPALDDHLYHHMGWRGVAMGGFDDVARVMGHPATPARSAAAVQYRRPGDSDMHALLVVRVEAGVAFLDVQAGTYADLPHGVTDVELVPFSEGIHGVDYVSVNPVGRFFVPTGPDGEPKPRAVNLVGTPGSSPPSQTYHSAPTSDPASDPQKTAEAVEEMEEVGPSQPTNSPTAPIPQAQGRTTAFVARYHEVMAGFDLLALSDEQILDYLDELTSHADDGEIIFYPESLSAHLLNAIGELNQALTADSPLRGEVTTFVHDVLLAVAAVPTRTRVVPVRNDLVRRYRHDLREIVTLTPRRAFEVLVRIAGEVRAGASTVATLASIGYGSGQPLAQRLARLALLNLQPLARAQLISDALFIRLLDSPLLWEARYAVSGGEEQLFLNTCLAAAVNQHVRSQMPNIAGLLLLGRAVTNTITAQWGSPDGYPVLGKLDRVRDRRTVRQLMEQRVRRAHEEFIAIEQQIEQLLIDSQQGASIDPAHRHVIRRKLEGLTVRWSRIMQKLALLVLPIRTSSSKDVAVLTRKLFADQWWLSKYLSLHAVVDRLGRRLVGMESAALYGMALQHVVQQLDNPTAKLSDWLTEPEFEAVRLDALWREVRTAGGILVGVEDHAVYLRAVMIDGERRFAIGDPMRANLELVSPTELARRSEREHWEVARRHLVNVPTTEPPQVPVAGFIQAPASKDGAHDVAATDGEQVEQHVDRYGDSDTGRSVDLLGVLRSSAKFPDAWTEDPLGPDLFGFRKAPKPPPMLAGVNQDDIHTDQLQSLLEQLDMASTEKRRSHQPLNVPALVGDPRSVLRLERRTDRRKWSNGTSIPDSMADIPEVMEVPLLFHAIWLGSPLSGRTEVTRQFRANLADRASKGLRVVLWTDISRAEFDLAAQASANGEGRLAQVRQVLDWARENSILLVNVDEVFHAGAPMLLNDEFRTELAKGMPLGFAAASDILRVEIMVRFGGIYADGDNLLLGTNQKEIYDALRAQLAADGFALGHDDLTVGNDAMAAARRHPFMDAYRKKLKDNYALPQEKLGKQFEGRSRAESEALDKSVVQDMARRNSVTFRTGPENLEGLPWAGFRTSSDLPPLRVFSVASARSWVPGYPLERSRSFAVEDVPEMVKAAAATLVRELYNRAGDLHLTYVAPIIHGLPERYCNAAWRAVVQFILGEPRLAARVKTVTDRVLTVPVRRRDPYVIRLELPADVLAMLGLEDVGVDRDPPGRWHLAELARPVMLARLPSESIGTEPKLYDLLKLAFDDGRRSEEAVNWVAVQISPHFGTVTGTGSEPALTMIANEADHQHIRYRAMIEWAHKLMSGADMSGAGSLLKLLETDISAWKAELGSHAPDMTQIAQRRQQLGIVINAWRTVGLPDPPGLSELADLDNLLDRDPVAIARHVAYAINSAVDLRIIDQHGEVTTRRIDPAGRVWQIGEDGIARYEIGTRADLYQMLETAVHNGADAEQSVTQVIDQIADHISTGTDGTTDAPELTIVANQVEAVYRNALTVARNSLHNAEASVTNDPMRYIANHIGLWHREMADGAPDVTLMLKRLDRIRSAAATDAAARQLQSAIDSIETAVSSADPIGMATRIAGLSGRTVKVSLTGRDGVTVTRNVEPPGKPLIEPDQPQEKVFDGAGFFLPWNNDQPANVEVPVGPGQRTAGQILADLRAAQISDAPPKGLLGPDLFGLRKASPPSSMLAGVDQSQVPPGRLWSFLRKLNLAASMPNGGDVPSRAPLRIDDLDDLSDHADVRGGVLKARREHSPRAWSSGDEIPARHGEIPAVLELPLVFHSIWLGSALTEDSKATREFRRNLADRADRGLAVVLWTDISRSTFRDAARADPTGDGPLAKARQMLDWAQQYNIALVNVDEMFHAGAPMLLHDEFRTELAKGMPLGFAAASDVLRVEIMVRFGGIYSDGDNELMAGGVEAIYDRLRSEFEADGYAIGATRVGERLKVGNAEFVAIRNHPFFLAYRDHINGKYALPQADIHERFKRRRRADADSDVDARIRRNSVMYRTGPGALITTMREAGYSTQTSVPLFTVFTSGSALSWLPSDPLAPVRLFTHDEAPDVVRKVVSTLVRQLYNREGNLHLTHVAPLVNGLPDPASAWRAVIAFIVGEPTLVSRMRSVTDRLVMPDGEKGGSYVAKVELPSEALAMLSLDNVSASQDLGLWSHNEPIRPLTLYCTLAELRASARFVHADTDDAVGPDLFGLRDAVLRSVRHRGDDPAPDELEDSLEPEFIFGDWRESDSDSADESDVLPLLRSDEAPDDKALRGITDDELTVVKEVVTILVWQLYDQDGHLHLPDVTTLVAELPEPHTIWRAVFRFLLGEPTLASRIRTVTERLRMPGNTSGEGSIVKVDLPPDVWTMLGLSEPPADQEPPDGLWFQDALRRPVTVVGSAPAVTASAIVEGP